MPILVALYLIALPFAAATAQEKAGDHFLRGGNLLTEGNYAAALEEFEAANRLRPDQPEVLFGLGACFNALGRYAEAKADLEKSFQILESRPRTIRNWGPIDIGYYALLADIHANLNEFEAAVETIGEYVPPDPKRGGPSALEALDTVKKTLAAKIRNNGLTCLRSGDLGCANRAFEQMSRIEPATPETLIAIAETAEAQAERAPDETDEEKAKKVELFRAAIDYARRAQGVEGGSLRAKRLLARALGGTRDAKDYQESVTILTSLWEASAGQPERDTTILLDLTTAYLNGDQWDQALRTATSFIEAAPEASRGQGYCKRSYAHYRLGQYQSAIDDGSKCTNADGSPRSLRHVDLSRREIERQKAIEAAAAAAQKRSSESDCVQLNQDVRWAKVAENLDLDTLVQIISHYEGAKTRCAEYLKEADLAELCRSGLFTASNPTNLWTMKAEDLKNLEAVTTRYSKLCGPSLTESQRTGLRNALKDIGSRLAASR